MGRGVTPEQVEDVKADIYAEPWKDPQLFPDLLHKAITELGRIATDPVAVLRDLSLARNVNRPPVQIWAEGVLTAMQGRAVSGVPFDEPAYGDLGPTHPKDA